MTNRDRRDSQARAYVVELVEASPLPPPFPDAADESAGPPQNLRGGAPQGLAVAAATFLLIVGVAAGAAWFALSGRQSGLGTNAVASGTAPVAAAPNQAAVVADDGTVLRGLLWSGDSVGIIVAPGYSNDAGDAASVAESLARSGHTVLFLNVRGQRPSGGLADSEMLPADLRAAVADLETRGVDDIYLVGFRQSATAAIVLAAEPSGLKGVAAVFAYQTYEGLDAVAAAGVSTAPLLVIGAEGATGSQESAEALAAAAGDSQATILSARPPAALSSDHFSPKVVRAVLEFVRSDG
ncbi:MAG: hypothetical protein HKN91_03430 [Acidimicrobiia bacterium]|nr:hypothetical protein [Acidimicrobiia bacterium]